MTLVKPYICLVSLATLMVVSPTQLFARSDRVISRFLGLRAVAEERCFIDKAGTASSAWAGLRVRQEKQGCFAQILLIQEAFTVPYSRTERFAITTYNLTVKRIYAIGTATEDVFLPIVMLNALSVELPGVRDHVATALQRTAPSPLRTFVYVVTTNNSCVDNVAATAAPAEVLARSSTTRNKGSKKICSHCKSSGHLANPC
ncbi:hypothetical protein NEOLEDRAFT_1167317 [Neolentinus lepideus HHB14362 ss-1]|uniref:CCHC-type domain-containing protein n=1 Tax=Neolentinus lepideus HHB14362 ss-1 TaxID=1314782 RepID=A0A165UX57_9AGAM|nr:hypothetical protein NEOLEDRAFT_1167317 [Neolentinus lepideus HHB14362 ss-1]